MLCDFGELVDLLGGEPVEDQAPDLLPVAGNGGPKRRAAVGGDRGVNGPAVAAMPFDQAAPAHPAELVVQSALFPPEPAAESGRSLPPFGCLGEGDEHGVVGVRQATVGLQLLLEAAAQHLLHLIERSPGDHFALVQRPLCCLHSQHRTGMG